MKEHQAYIERIDRGIEDLLEKHSAHPLHDPLTYSLEGGKRLRPLVVLLVNESLGKGTEDPIPATSAIELLHTVSLIHDDIIDKENVRRDKPPYYQLYGVDSALLSADFVLGVILEVASAYREKAVGIELSKAAIEMSSGEETRKEGDPRSRRGLMEELHQDPRAQDGVTLQGLCQRGGSPFRPESPRGQDGRFRHEAGHGVPAPGRPGGHREAR